MEHFLLDSLFVVVVVLTAFAVSRTGGVRAGLWFVGILASAIVVLNLYEPLTQQMIRAYVMNRKLDTWPYGRFFCLLGIFAASLGFLYGVFRWLLPENPAMTPKTETVIRWLSGVFAGYVVAAFLLIALQTFPASSDFGGYFPTDPGERPGVLMQTAPDYQLLKVIQIASGDVFAIGENGAIFPAELPSIGEETPERWSSFPRRYQRWRAKLDELRKEKKKLQNEIDQADENAETKTESAKSE